MDRLTFNGNFCDIAKCLEGCGGKYCPDGYCSQRKVWERLKEYEDTGLEPETISQLKKIPEIFNYDAADPAQLKQPLHKLQSWNEAEQDGRLVVLPCKVGDTVWFNTFGNNETGWLGVCPHKVSRFEISAIVPGEYTYTDLPLYTFGKSVFLTREEAEAALEAQEDGDGNE